MRENTFEKDREELKEIRDYASSFTLLTKEEEFALTSEMYDIKTKLIPLALSFDLAQPVNQGVLNYLGARFRIIVKELVDRNLRLVLKICQSTTYINKGLPIFDLFMAGFEGLSYAIIKKFEPYRGWKLSTYATFWIHQRIQRALASTGSAIKIAGNKQDQKSKIKMVVREYIADKKNAGRKPNAEMISLLLKDKYDLELTGEEVAELGRLEWAVLSLDETSNEEEGSLTLVDYLEAPENYEPEHAYRTVEIKDRLNQLLDGLTDEEKLIVSMAHGLIDSVKKSNKTISKYLDMTEKDVKTILEAAMAKMKAATEGEKFFD